MGTVRLLSNTFGKTALELEVAHFNFPASRDELAVDSLHLASIRYQDTCMPQPIEKAEKADKAGKAGKAEKAERTEDRKHAGNAEHLGLLRQQCNLWTSVPAAVRQSRDTTALG